MTYDKTFDSANLGELKDKFFAEFEKMSQMLQDEKNTFAEQMARKKNELDAEIKIKLTELTTEKENLDGEIKARFAELTAKKEELDSKIKTKLAELDAEKNKLDEAKDQLQKKGANFTKEVEKKTRVLERMKEEIEQEKIAHFKKIAGERESSNSREIKKLQEVERKTRELETRNKELVKRKSALENDLKNIQQTQKKIEDVHFQKMAALKNKLEELENEIEQNLFFTADQENIDYTKKTRKLIITTVTGETYRGKINIGSKDRLSDMFTIVKTPFIVMYDVVFKGEQKTTVIINKQNIVSIKPLDGPAPL